MTRKTKPAFTRFAEKIIADQSGCILWIGTKNQDGYGVLILQCGKKWKKTVPAHRYAWEMDGNQIPDGFCVLHKCDNPACVNVDHLFLGTRDENNKDRAKKGRSAVMRGEKNNSAKLNETQVREILDLKGSSISISCRFGVSSRAIRHIREGETWTHI